MKFFPYYLGYLELLVYLYDVLIGDLIALRD